MQTLKEGVEKNSKLSQSKNETFTSADGFKIDLPKSEPTITTDTFNYSYIKGVGKRYNWKNPDGYDYQVAFYDIDNGRKSLSDKERRDYLEANKKTLTDALKAANMLFTEKKYTFNGNEGVEIQADNSKANAKMISRTFIVNQRLYYIGLTYSTVVFEDSQIYKIADSFALVDSETKNNTK